MSRESNGYRVRAARPYDEIEKKNIKINHDGTSEECNGANNNCHESAGREIIGQAICDQQGRGNRTPLCPTINNPINVLQSKY